MKEFWVWILVVLLGGGLLACKTLGGAKDKATDEFDAAISRLPYPDETRFVLRVNPQLARDVLERLGENVEESSDEYDYYPVFASRYLEHLVWELLHVQGDSNVVDDGEKPTFENLSDDRALVFSTSTQKQDHLFEGIAYSAPNLGFFETSLLPTHRIFLPTDDPDALRSEIDEACDMDDEACAHVLAVEPYRSWVVVDIGPPGEGAIEPTIESQRDESVAKGAASPFSRVTPAAEAFFSPDSPFAFYGRVEDLHAYDRVHDAGEFELYLTRSIPHPDDLLDSDYDGMARYIDGLSAPEAREAEDVSVVLHKSGTLDMHRTLTERGSRVARRARVEASVPTIDFEGKSAEFEYSGDYNAALEAAVTPSWAKAFIDFEETDSAAYGLFRNRAVNLAYPIGNIRGRNDWRAKVSREQKESGAQSWDPSWPPAGPTIGSVNGVIATRGATDERSVEADQSKGLPEPRPFKRGAHVVLVERSSLADEMFQEKAETFEQIREDYGQDRYVDVERQGDEHRLYRFGSHIDESNFGDPEPVDHGLSARVGGDHLLELLEWFRPGLAGAGPEEFGLRGLSEVKVRYSSNESTATLSVAVDSSDVTTAPDAKIDLVQSEPEAPKSCSREAAELTYEILEMSRTPTMTPERSPPEPNELLERIDAELAGLEEECDEDAESLIRARKAWWAYGAVRAQVRGDYARVERYLERACDLGDDKWCAEAKSAKQVNDTVVWPRARSTQSAGDLPGKFVHFSPDGLLRLPRFQDQTLEFGIEAIEHTADNWREHAIERMSAHDGPRPPLSTLVGFDPRIQSRYATALFERVRVLKESETKRKQAKPRHQTDEWLRRVRYLKFALEPTEETDTPILRSPLFHVEEVADDKKDPVIRLRIDEAGIAVTVDGDPVDFDEACGDEERTVCPDDPRQIRALLDEHSDGTFEAVSGDGLTELEAAYDLEKLHSALETIDALEVDATCEIIVDERIPFGLVATIAGTLVELTGAEKTDTRPFKLHLRTQ